MKPEDARPGRSSDPAPDGTAAHPANVGSLWEQFLARENLAEALRRVEQNAGAPGIDGMSTKELGPWLKDHWSEVRSQLDAGTYRPQPVRRVMIPKPSGGMRKLGVPTVTVYHEVAQAAFGFAGGHASVSSVARRAPSGVVRSSCRCWSHLQL